MKIKKQKEKYAHQTILEEIETCDLDLDLQDYMFGNNVNGHDFVGTIKNQNKKGNYYWCGENNYLEIDNVINILKKLKKAGATHVDITPHGDHHGYYFYGNIFREATEAEIENERIKHDNAKKLELKIEIDKARKLLEILEKKNDSKKT